MEYSTREDTHYISGGKRKEEKEWTANSTNVDSDVKLKE